MNPPHKVFITGASSGIGAALARVYARPGMSLGLVARRSGLLAELAAALEATGAKVQIQIADVTDAGAMTEAAQLFIDRFGVPDRVFANAGIGGTQELQDASAAEVARVFQVNLLGVIHTLIPFVKPMVQCGAGTLVAVSSMSAHRVIPGATAYSTSKAAVSRFADGLRMELAGTGVHAMSVCPGFVRTAMTKELTNPMPFLMDADQAAQLASGAVERQLANYDFPWPMRWLRIPMQLVPEWVYLRCIGRTAR